MDKIKYKRSVLENYQNTTSGYSIEFGETAYELQGNTLEERIQAARKASSIAKQEQTQKNKGKTFLINNNSSTLEKNTTVQNMTIKKTAINPPEFKRKNRQMAPSFRSDSSLTTNSSLICPMKKTINTVSQDNNISNLLKPTYKGGGLMQKTISTISPDNNNISNLLKPTYKGGGLMQRRLEAIKSNKQSNKILLGSGNNLEFIKFPNSLNKNVSYPTVTAAKSELVTSTKNSFSSLTDTLLCKRNEYKTRSVVQKSHNLYFEHCDRTRNKTFNSDNPVTSVQSRLLRAKEEMKARSKLFSQNDVTKNKTTEKPPTSASGGISQDSNLPTHNLKNKTKRLKQSNQSSKKKIPTIISTTKNLMSNTSDFSKVIDNKLVTVQQIPHVIYNRVISKPTETIVSSNLQSKDSFKKSKLKELDSFSFIIPETTSVQQRLENKKKIQLDDSMEWEDVEPENIVDKVNDLRKSQHDYEPMEWIPDSIMSCDKINLCLVIDTNILLSDLKSITVVIDTSLPEFGFPTIVLPWQVLQELDCLKKSDNALGYRSREATRWLFDILSKRHPRLKGQPMTPKISQNPDDAILHCAIIVKEHVNVVYLITDDRILNIKAEFSEITTKSSQWLHSVISVKEQHNSDTFQGSLPST